jgi:hypothetical protein
MIVSVAIVNAEGKLDRIYTGPSHRVSIQAQPGEQVVNSLPPGNDYTWNGTSWVKAAE